MDVGRERGEAAAQCQACVARFPGQPECAGALVQIEDRSIPQRPGMRLPTEYGVNQEGLRKRVFQIQLEGCGAGLNAGFDVFIEGQGFQSE